nr:hypothetical protein [Tanacetum cinerariifolium]
MSPGKPRECRWGKTLMVFKLNRGGLRELVLYNENEKKLVPKCVNTNRNTEKTNTNGVGGGTSDVSTDLLTNTVVPVVGSTALRISDSIPIAHRVSEISIGESSYPNICFKRRYLKMMRRGCGVQEMTVKEFEKLARQEGEE